MQSPPDITALLKTALAEDIGSGDVTSLASVPPLQDTIFYMNSRAEMVVCGLVFLPELFAMIDPDVNVILRVEDGTKIEAGGASLATLRGPARALLAGERTALNLVQHLSGVATLTRQYVDAVAGTNAKILDTRKTIPGLRAAQKYAVRCGGGVNHRMGLYDAILIKDNHIAMAGGVREAVDAANAYIDSMAVPNGAPRPSITVECDTLAQVELALSGKINRLLLDNMSNETLCEAIKKVRRVNGVETEASGNVNLQTVRAIAETGVDYISVGKLTHSAVAVDIGLDAEDRAYWWRR